jgi:Carboxypeptidase regulatory-like domain
MQLASASRGRNFNRLLSSSLLVLLTLLFAQLPAKAQIGSTATIQGTVTDPSGAVIPGAQVTVKNLGTGATIVQKTTNAGFYSISPLDPGDYSVTAEAPGFKALRRNNVHVNGMQVLGLNMSLTLGEATQTVTVSTAPPPLQTQDASLGAVMEDKVYEALPLEMGSAGSPDQQRVTDFASLMPGVSGNETKNNQTDEPMVVDGQQQGTAMYFEGIPFTFPGGEGDPRYIWPAFGVQSVSQFQLLTSSFSSEYAGLDVENFNVKSGSNEIHGSVYDLARNTAFDAYGFLPPTNKVTGQTYKPPEHMNEYGIDAGLPLIHNKLFFFGNFEGYRYSTINAPVYNTIPTQAMFGGDFSATGVNIYDPTTETCTATSCTRQQYVYNGVNNVIPPGEISPIAQQLSQFWKGVTYANSNLTNNFVGTYNYGLSNWSGNVRIDYHPSDKQTISGILATGRQGLIGPSSQTSNVGPFPYRLSKYYRPITRVGIVEDTYVITPHLVNQFKYGTAQYHSPDFNPTYGLPGTAQWAASALGINGLPNGQAAGGFPAIKFSGDFAPAQWGTDNGTQSDENTFNVVENLQWVHGKHSISFGGQIQWLQNNTISAFGGSTPATLNFNYAQTGQFEANSTTVNKNTGLPFASFMTGAVDSGSYNFYAPEAQDTGERYRPFAFYVNDIYRAFPKLTVDLGLRWDYMPPYHEAQARWSFLNPELTNPVTGSLGALEFAGNVAPGVSCNCATPVRSYHENIGPRLGFAYQADSKTVVHASFGIYYTGGGGVNSGSASNLGYSSAPSVSSPGFGLPAFYLNGNPNFLGATTVNGNLNDPTSTTFGGTGFSPVTPPFFNSAYGTYYSSNAVAPYKLSTTVSYVDPWYGGRAPQFEGWSFGVQRMLTQNMTATVSYVGNEAHFIPTPGSGSLSGARGLYSNQLDPKYLTLGSTLNQTATPTNTPGGLPYASYNNTVERALTLFPQYNGVSDEWGSVGNTAYDAVQLTIQQRASHGLTFTLNYTYSKTVDDVGTFRSGYAIPAGIVAGSSKAYPMDRIDRSLSLIDMPQNLTFTSVYNLPFGKGHWGGGNPVVSQIVGGWSLSDIFTYVAGNPLAITGSSCTAPGQGTCMPSYAAGFNGSARQNGGWGHGATAATLGKIQYINPNAFEATPDYQIGNLARTGAYGLRGPSNYNIDGSLRRTFDILPKERAQFVFEADVFNAVNHVWFGSTSSNAVGKIGQGFSSSAASSTSLGVVTGQANLPRQWQFEGHIVF